MLKNRDKKKVAYLIGFLAGDGSFEGGKGRTPRMGFSSTDEEIVDWIGRNFLEINKDITRLNHNLERGIIAKLPSWRKTFPTSFSKCFKNYGILSKKRVEPYKILVRKI